MRMTLPIDGAAALIDEIGSLADWIDDVGVFLGDRQRLRFAVAGEARLAAVLADGVAEVVIGLSIGRVAPAPGDVNRAVGADGGAPPVGVALVLAVDQGMVEGFPGLRRGV